MNLVRTRSYPAWLQYFICIALVLVVTAISFSLRPIIGYRVVALLLLMTVSVVAMLFGMYPVLAAAFLSALIWNFFFIPPQFTFHIDHTEDILFFVLYFLIAFVNTVLTIRIRAAEKKAREKEEKDNIIRLYGTLFNSLSHEFRTPVTNIIGALDTLRDNQENLKAGDQAELLQVIDKSAMRLHREVDNLLNINRLESGMLRLTFTWCDVKELVNRVIGTVQPGNRAIEFQPGEELPLFRLDEGILEVVLINLLLNAVQYTPDKSRITVSVSNSQSGCLLAISDNGPGFPAGTIPLAFDKFYRLPGSRTGGLGLGLSIVRGFVGAHGGEVTLVNNPGGGCTFTILIPAETSFIGNLKNE